MRPLPENPWTLHRSNTAPFVKTPRIILTKRQILEKLWDIDGDFVDEHTLTTIISRIRKKIETDERKYIKTAYGMGYQWIGGEPR